MITAMTVSEWTYLRAIFVLALAVATGAFPLRGQDQQTRIYFFGGPTITSAAAAAQPTTFGILPSSAPATASPTTNYYSAGLGMEFRQSRYWGIGFDLAGVVPSNGKALGNTVGTLSGNGFGHIFRHSQFELYCTGGYTLLFHDFAENGLNGGVGATWAGSHWGGLFEVRVVYVPEHTLPVLVRDRYTEIRLGFFHK
jgi:hypothetical protein